MVWGRAESIARFQWLCTTAKLSDVGVDADLVDISDFDGFLGFSDIRLVDHHW